MDYEVLYKNLRQEIFERSSIIYDDINDYKIIKQPISELTKGQNLELQKLINFIQEIEIEKTPTTFDK